MTSLNESAKKSTFERSRSVIEHTEVVSSINFSSVMSSLEIKLRNESESRSINCEDYKVFVHDIDSRKNESVDLPLLFIHGAGSSHFSWTHQLREFQTTHRTIAVDLSGHGNSEQGPSKASIGEVYVKEVASVVEHLDLKKFVLIGHSMGGAVAMSYALEEQFRKPIALVLVDTLPAFRIPRILIGLMIEKIKSAIAGLRVERSAVDREPLWSMVQNKTASRSIPRNLLRDFKAVRNFDVTHRLAEIDIPTLVMVGEDDDVFPIGDTLKFESALPRADIAIVRGANHSPHSENPEEFNRILRRFLYWVEQSILTRCLKGCECALSEHASYSSACPSNCQCHLVDIPEIVA